MGLTIDEAVARVKAGGVIAFATDTVPGLGCLASSADAVAEIFALKGREPGKPLVLFVGSRAEAEAVTGALPSRLAALLDRCWPGPLTAVLPLAGRWPDGVGADGRIGIRVPASPAILAVARRAGGPLATTSANRSGEPPLADPRDAERLWAGRVAALEGEPAARGSGTASTVADFTVWPPRVLRPGALSQDVLARLAGEIG